MTGSGTAPGWPAVIVFLLLFSFFLGLPLFHYVTAFMIALILENRAHPDQVDVLGIFGALQNRRRHAIEPHPRSAGL